MKGDQRVPYTIELDAELTVIAEYADMTALDHVAEGRATPAQETSPERRKAQAVARWVTAQVDVNPIPGSEELREEFFAAKQKLVSSYGGAPCPSCEVGKLIRAFRGKLEAKGLL